MDKKEKDKRLKPIVKFMYEMLDATDDELLGDAYNTVCDMIGEQVSELTEILESKIVGLTYEVLERELNKLGLYIVKVKCYDAQSGWEGLYLYVKNKSGQYLHDNGEFSYSEERKYSISGNGYIHDPVTYAKALVFVTKCVSNKND